MRYDVECECVRVTMDPPAVWSVTGPCMYQLRRLGYQTHRIQTPPRHSGGPTGPGRARTTPPRPAISPAELSRPPEHEPTDTGSQLSVHHPSSGDCPIVPFHRAVPARHSRSPATCRRPAELQLGLCAARRRRRLLGRHVSHLAGVVGRFHDDRLGAGRRAGHLRQGDLDDAALRVEQGALAGQHVLQVLGGDALQGAGSVARRRRRRGGTTTCGQQRQRSNRGQLGIHQTAGIAEIQRREMTRPPDGETVDNISWTGGNTLRIAYYTHTSKEKTQYRRTSQYALIMNQSAERNWSVRAQIID